MEKRSANYKRIIVGLSLSDHDARIVESSVNIAQKLKAELVFVNAILPFQSYSYAGEGTLFPMSSYENSFRELSESQGVKKLQNIVNEAHSFAQKELSISYRITYAEPASGLVDVAEQENADLIICGYNPKNDNNVFFGTSTAHNLFAESSRPVLAIPTDKSYTFSQGVSFGDANDAKSFDRMTRLYALCQQLHMKTLHHVHVVNISDAEIEHMVEMVQNAIIAGKIESQDNFTKDLYVEETKHSLKQQLEDRYANAKKQAPSGEIDYRCDILFGTPKEKIAQAISGKNIDMVAFGQHHIVDRKNWSLGHVPYHTMLSLGLPILVLTN